MRINHEVIIETSEKKRQDVFNFKDLTPGIWYCVDKMSAHRQVYAVVFAERECGLKDPGEDCDTYDRFPRCLIIMKEPDFNQAFVPDHSAWGDSNWRLCDKSIKINVSFEQED